MGVTAELLKTVIKPAIPILPLLGPLSLILSGRRAQPLALPLAPNVRAIASKTVLRRYGCGLPQFNRLPVPLARHVVTVWPSGQTIRPAPN